MSEEVFCGELSKLVKHMQCSICLNLMIEPKMTQCLHRFCGQCITTLIQSNAMSGDSKQICRCPQCSEEITEKSLRDQFELKDAINQLRNTIDILKTDSNLSEIFNKIVLLSLNDSTIGENHSINNNKENEESIVDKTFSDLESNRQKSTLTTTIDEVMSSWPTNNSISNENNSNNDECNDNTIEELSETQNDSNINISSIIEYSNNSIELITNDNEVSKVKAKNESKQSGVQSNASLHLKSQDLILNRSSVSYGFQRKLNQKEKLFDEVVSKSNKSYFSPKNTIKHLPVNNSYKRKLNNKVNKRYNPLLEDEKDIDFEAAKYAADLVEPMTRFIQQKQTSISRNISENKKKFKRIRIIESDDEMVENVKVSDNGKHTQQVKSVLVEGKNAKDCRNEFSDLSDDELMVSIHSDSNATKESLNVISPDVSLQNDTNSVDSYNSDTQLISSSPITSDGSI